MHIWKQNKQKINKRQKERQRERIDRMKCSDTYTLIPAHLLPQGLPAAVKMVDTITPGLALIPNMEETFFFFFSFSLSGNWYLEIVPPHSPHTHTHTQCSPAHSSFLSPFSFLIHLDISVFVSVEGRMQETVQGWGRGGRFGRHDRDVSVRKIPFCKRNDMDGEIINK